MPILAAPIEFPPHLHEMRAGDVDGDGIEELVMVSRVPKGRRPDAVQLTVVDFDADGNQTGRTVHILGQKALYWDIHEGIWAVDGDGAYNIVGPASFTLSDPRIGAVRTPLGGLGPTTPAPADIAGDIDHDGIPEVFVMGGGRIHTFSADGRARGSVPAPSDGSVSTQQRAGATQLITSTRSRPFHVADADGDGRDDLLLPRGDRLTVHFSGENTGERREVWRLPLDLEPRKDPTQSKEGERREVENAWFRDFDNDGKVDLLVHQWVIDGSWFGATAELSFSRGNGSGLDPAQVVRTSTAAFDVRLLDFDGDGDTDLLVPMVDIGLGNLGRALVSRKVEVDVALFAQDDGRFATSPEILRSFAWSITDPDSVQVSLDGDINGDGIVDLVKGDNGDQVLIFISQNRSIPSQPTARHTTPIPKTDSPFFVRDLTGDGRAEVIVWGPGAKTGTVLRMP